MPEGRRRQASILVADDQAEVRALLEELLGPRVEGVILVETGEEALLVLARDSSVRLVLLDLDFGLGRRDGLSVLEEIHRAYPDLPVVILTGNATVESTVRAMRRVLATVDRIASIPRSVLGVGGRHLGERGTGKELVAAALHYRGERAPHPFVTVNCAAIPEELLESELFGHEKGAFTRVRARKPGLFELAHRGTLFLDEIGSTSLDFQKTILRVLEYPRFHRVQGRSRSRWTSGSSRRRTRSSSPRSERDGSARTRSTASPSR
jgi:DNA-binding NtrC family response regulator